MTHLACKGATLHSRARIGAIAVHDGERKGGILARSNIRWRVGVNNANPHGRCALSRDVRGEKENGREKAHDADLYGARAALHRLIIREL